MLSLLSTLNPHKSTQARTGLIVGGAAEPAS